MDIGSWWSFGDMQPCVGAPGGPKKPHARWGSRPHNRVVPAFAPLLVQKLLGRWTRPAACRRRCGGSGLSRRVARIAASTTAGTRPRALRRGQRGGWEPPGKLPHLATAASPPASRARRRTPPLSLLPHLAACSPWVRAARMKRRPARAHMPQNRTDAPQCRARRQERRSHTQRTSCR